MSGISLMEFIESREAEIKEIRRSLYEELKQLKAARLAVEGVPQQRALHTTAVVASDGDLTIKEMALDVIEQARRPLTAEEILQRIKEKFSKELQRTSLSPQLSRLKQDDRLSYDSESSAWGLPTETDLQSSQASNSGDGSLATSNDSM